MELSLFSKYQEFTPNEKRVNKRSLIIQQFVDEINKERPYTYTNVNGKKTKVGFITPRAVALKVSHISENDLIYFLSVCKDYKNRNGSFSKCFFGSIKPVEKLA
jgi:hypothetical protein